MKLLSIIVNYKTPDMTLDAASAALEQLQHIKRGWKLLIVDNDSQDGSYEKLKQSVYARTTKDDLKWSHVRVVHSEHNGGFGAGNNFAIRDYLEGKERADYFYILNSDAFPEQRSISLLIEQLDAQPELGIVGSYIHGPDGSSHTTAFRFPGILSEFEGAIRFSPVTKMLKNHIVPIGIPEQNLAVDWLSGASMMIRREVLDQVGLFDEDFFLYFEETDLCRRAKKAGWKIMYVRKSSVCHIGSVSTGMKEWNKIPGYWLDSRRLYFTKNHGKLYYWLATLSRILGELIWKIRVKLEGKTDNGPERFIADLSSHFFKRRVD